MIGIITETNYPTQCFASIFLFAYKSYIYFMKKIILLAAILTLVTSLNAQSHRFKKVFTLADTLRGSIGEGGERLVGFNEIRYSC